MKRTLALILALGFVIHSAQAVDVEVAPYPQCEEDGCFRVVTGSLTEVVAQLTGEKNGAHFATFICGFQELIPFHEKACCVDDTTSGKQGAFEITILTVRVNYDRIYLPEWHQRTTNCASFTNEWNAYSNRVKVHEIGHREDSKALFVTDKIKPIANKQTWDWVSECKTAADYDAAAADKELLEKYNKAMKIFADAIAAEEERICEAYHKRVGEGVALPDTSVECK